MATINMTQFNRRATNTPVTQPLPGRTDMVPDSDGGFVWQVDDWANLDRFLILGVEKGTYYIKEPELLKQKHGATVRCIKADGVRAVKRITEVSDKGLAYRNDPAIFALALALTHGDTAAKAAAAAALPKVCRIGTHLFHFAQYINALRGWGRAICRAASGWYTSREADQLAFQAIKYQQRDGWTHADILRLAHPKAASAAQDSVLRWMVGGMGVLGAREVKRKAKETVAKYPSRTRYLPELIKAFEEAKTASEKRVIELIVESNLPREAIPTQHLNSLAVWEALLQKMPLTALIRNLGKMTSIGLVKPLSAAAKLVRNRLTDAAYLRKSRIHPMAVLVAHRVYGQGRGIKGDLTWTPVPSILADLDQAFYAAFPNVVPCGKPVLIALDVSGSMGSQIAGSVLRSCEATAALSLIHLSVEPECHVFGFAHQFVELGIRKGMSLDDAMNRALRSNFGSTDISLAFQYALQNKLEVGGFICMTDGEVNCGRHPAQALREYRQKFVRDARSVFVATCANDFTVNDPTDKFGLDVVGFDASAPPIIANFIRGDAAAKAEETVADE